MQAWLENIIVDLKDLEVGVETTDQKPMPLFRS